MLCTSEASLTIVGTRNSPACTAMVCEYGKVRLPALCVGPNMQPEDLVALLLQAYTYYCSQL